MSKKNSSWQSSGLKQLFDMSPLTGYAYWVRQATHILRDADFGTWQGTDGGVPDFTKDAYDRDFWTWESDPEFIRVLQVKPGKQPADAITAILNNVYEWRIDCDHTVQIANLYAVRMMLGAAKFNARVAPQMLLRDRESTGLKTVFHYGRDTPDDPWRVVVSFDPAKVKGDPAPSRGNVQLAGPFTFAAGPPFADKSDQSILNNATPGSRVRFTNLQANLSDPFRHENCIKLKTDLYVGGGLQDPVTGNEFIQDRIKIKLALKTNPEPDRAYIDSNVFIDEVEMFEQL